MFVIFQKHINVQCFNVKKQFVRYRLVNTRHPRPPHFWAKKINQVVKPVFAKTYDFYFPQHLKCRKILNNIELQEKEENPYERILAKELIDEFNRSKMILIFHQNPVTGYEFHRSKVKFKKEGMELMRNSRQTVKMAVENTKFISILQLFHSHTLMLCSPEIKLDVVYNLMKQMSFLVLMAGIVENKFLHRNKLDELSQLKNLETARMQLVETLNLSAKNLLQIVTQPHVALISYLDQHKKMQQNIEKSEASIKADESDIVK